MERLVPVPGPIKKIPQPVHTIAGVPTAVAAFVGRAASGPVDQPVHIDSFSDFQTNFGGLWPGSEMGYAVADFFINGGGQAIVVRLQSASSADDPLSPADYLPTGGPSTRQGLYALEGADAFNLLVLPPDRGPAGSLDVDATVIAAAATYCEQRLAFLLMDPPVAWTTVTAAQAAMSSPATPFGNSSYAALFFPRILKPDPLADGTVQTYAPSGAVAGVIARLDAQHGVWHAPAGTAATLNGISGLAVPVNDLQNGALQTLAVNCLRTFPPTGSVVFGARTMDGADGASSPYRYIPVRRLALYLEQSLRSGLTWTAFQPDNETLWSSISLAAEAFLQTAFRQGAFQGTTPQQAYFIKCDATTQANAAAGIVNVLIGFAPLVPAEFVILNLQLAARPAAH